MSFNSTYTTLMNSANALLTTGTDANLNQSTATVTDALKVSQINSNKNVIVSLANQAQNTEQNMFVTQVNARTELIKSLR